MWQEAVVECTTLLLGPDPFSVQPILQLFHAGVCGQQQLTNFASAYAAAKQEVIDKQEAADREREASLQQARDATAAALAAVQGSDAGAQGGGLEGVC